MKTVYIASSIKNLNYEYEHLQWLRLFFLSNEYHLSEDWINHSLNIRNNKPYFKAAPNFDYMKVATEAIQDSDKLLFLLSSPSTFTFTLLRYALYKEREAIVICKTRTMLKKLEHIEEGTIIPLTFGTYQQTMKELI
jgi:hypothetical protein